MDTVTNIFETATRIGLRFETSRGSVSVEDLWKLPLTSTVDRPNLDSIALALDREIRQMGEVTSFVNDEKKPESKATKLRFDVVKHIIDTRKAESKAAEEAHVRSEKKQQLLAIIADKENETMRGKSIDELKALIATL